MAAASRCMSHANCAVFLYWTRKKTQHYPGSRFQLMSMAFNGSTGLPCLCCLCRYSLTAPKLAHALRCQGCMGMPRYATKKKTQHGKTTLRAAIISQQLTGNGRDMSIYVVILWYFVCLRSIVFAVSFDVGCLVSLFRSSLLHCAPPSFDHLEFLSRKWPRNENLINDMKCYEMKMKYNEMCYGKTHATAMCESTRGKPTRTPSTSAKNNTNLAGWTDLWWLTISYDD